MREIEVLTRETKDVNKDLKIHTQNHINHIKDLSDRSAEKSCKNKRENRNMRTAFAHRSRSIHPKSVRNDDDRLNKKNKLRENSIATIERTDKHINLYR